MKFFNLAERLGVLKRRPSAYVAEAFDSFYSQEGVPVPNIDELVNEKGLGIYREMLQRDDMVSSASSLMTFYTLSPGWELSQYSSEPIDLKINDFCEHNLREQCNFDRLLMDIMEAPFMGFCAIEKIRGKMISEGEFAGLQGFSEFIPLPQETVNLQRSKIGGKIDEFGVWQFKPGKVPYFSTDPKDYNHFRASDFILWHWKTSYGNPLGISILRSAFKHYFLKSRMIEWWARHMEYFGKPWVIVKAKAGTKEAVKTQIMNQLRKFMLVQYGVVDMGSEIEISNSADAGTSSAWVEGINHCNRAIARACLQPATLFESPELGSFSLGRTQRSAFDFPIQNLSNMIAIEVVKMQILRPLVDHNFGPQYNLPNWTFRPLNPVDRKTTLEIMSQMMNLGLDVSKDTAYNDLAMSRPGPKEDLIERPEPKILRPSAASNGNGKQKTFDKMNPPQPGRGRFSEDEELESLMRAREYITGVMTHRGYDFS